MKHFLITITYTVSAEQRSEVLPDHRVFLKTGYEKGWLLCSGPTADKTGGLVVARAPSLEDIQRFFEDDPYQQKNAATHAFAEFDPVLHQPFLADWVAGA